MVTTVSAIYRYPVKGLSAERSRLFESRDRGLWPSSGGLR